MSPEILEARVAPAIVLSNAVFTDERIIVSGTNDTAGSVDFFSDAPGSAAVLFGNRSLPVGPFLVELGYAEKGGVISAVNGMVQSNVLGQTRGLYVEDVRVAEGAALAEFRVRLSLAAASVVTVNYATAGETAAPGTDFTAMSGTLTFAPGELEKVVSVPLTGDGDIEGDEAFQLTLASAAGAFLADSSASATIVDDDFALAGIFATVASVSENSATLFAQVRLSSPAAVDTVVAFETVAATATADADFVGAPGTVTILAGQSSALAAIPLLQDSAHEGTEHFFVVFTLNGASTSLSVALTDDDAPSAPAVSIADISSAEGTGGTSNIVATITLSAPAPEAITLRLGTGNDTATPFDFAAGTGTLTFDLGQTTGTISVPVNPDNFREADESFWLAFDQISGAIAGDTLARLTILNDDAGQPGLEITDVTVTEGSQAVFTVTLSATAASTVTVNYATNLGTATAGVDYTNATGALAFLAGETSKTIAVNTTGDATDELDEVFGLFLSSATGAILADGTGTGTILDDDVVSIFVAPTSAPEGSMPPGTPTGSYPLMTFTVQLSAPAASTVTVTVATQAGTAQDAADFLGGTATLTFAAGETSKNVTVPIVPDTDAETAETFTLILSNPTNATLGTAVGTATIRNDDFGFELLAPTIAEGNSGSANATFTARLLLPQMTPFIANVITIGGSARAGVDYAPRATTLTFAAGETEKTFTVPIIGDTAFESHETFTLRATDGSGEFLASVVATILNDDALPVGLPALSMLDAIFVEGTGANGTGVVSAALSFAAQSPVTIGLRWRNGTARAGSDFGVPSTQITIPAGSDFVELPFTIGSDFVLENSEYFFVDATTVSGATLLDGTARITITNDDSGPRISDDAKTATWTDVDGDLITLKATKPVLTHDRFAMSPTGSGLQLEALFFDSTAAGTGITVTARGPGGTVNIGGILAENTAFASITVAGDVARIISGDIGKLTVGSLGVFAAMTDIEGSARTEILGRVGTFTVGGNIENALVIVNSIGALKVGGQLKGGTADFSGFVVARNGITTVEIKHGLAGGAGTYSGSLESLGGFGKITIGGSLQGGSGQRSGGLWAQGSTTATGPAGIASIVVKGAVIAGTGPDSGMIYSLGPIASVSAGALVGSALHRAKILGGGIGKITITTDVTFAEVGTGVRFTGSSFGNLPGAATATSGIGTVVVGGNWTASNLIADVSPGTDGRFGTTDDTRLHASTTATIGSVVIKGTVNGTTSATNPADIYAFAARTIGSFRAQNAAPALQATGIDFIGIGNTGDVVIREIA